MTSCSDNRGTGVNANTTSWAGAFTDGTKLFINDNNNRIIHWNAIPASNGPNADLVQGQPNMTSSGKNATTVSAYTIKGGASYSDGTRLFVADPSNHRVLIWSTLPTTNNQPANIVLGQADMTSVASGLAADKFNSPQAVHYDGSKLFVADTLNRRVLIWDTLPTTNGNAATWVVGQPNMTTNTSGVTAYKTSEVNAVYSDGTKLYVGDRNNHRFLIWNTIPAANNASANVVVGQPTMTCAAANATAACAVGTPTEKTINNPYSRVWSDGSKLIIADGSNNRVMIWNTVPTANYAAADVILGQADGTTATANNPALGANSLSGPQNVYSAGGRLYVADQGNHRVLIWNTIPTVNQTAADSVLGQPNMTSNTANNGGLDETTLSAPISGQGLTSAKVFIGDRDNSRVMIVPAP